MYAYLDQISTLHYITTYTVPEIFFSSAPKIFYSRIFLPPSQFFYKNPKLAALHIKTPQKLFTPFYYILTYYYFYLLLKKSTTNCVRLRRVYRAFTFQYLPLKGQRLLETLFLALKLSYDYFFKKILLYIAMATIYIPI